MSAKDLARWRALPKSRRARVCQEMREAALCDIGEAAAEPGHDYLVRWAEDKMLAVAVLREVGGETRRRR